MNFSQVLTAMGSINFDRLKTIWQLSWPQVIMLAGQFIIGIVDVWAAGQVGSDVQATIGFITQVQLLFMTIAMATMNGAVATISQSLGANDKLQAERYAGLAVIGGLSLGILLAIVGLVFQLPFLELMQTPPAILALSSFFLTIYLFSLPGQYMLTLGGAIFRSAKLVYPPLYVTIFVCVLNAFGNLAFGLGYWGFPSYGATGIACSTLISTAIGGIILFVTLIRCQLLTRNSFITWAWTKLNAPYMLRVSFPALGTSLLWQSGYLVLFMITATLPFNSVIAMAGLTSGMRIEAFLFLPGVAFNMTASILVGHALGAAKPEEAKRIFLSILGLACGSMSLAGLIIWPFRTMLAEALTPDPQVVVETVSYLTYNILSVPFTVGSVVLAGGLNGAGASIYPMVVFSSAVWLVRLPLAWLLGHFVWQSADGVYLSMLLSQIFQATALLYVLFYCNWTRFAMKPCK